MCLLSVGDFLFVFVYFVAFVCVLFMCMSVCVRVFNYFVRCVCVWRIFVCV